jgi:hypothetical protein
MIHTLRYEPQGQRQRFEPQEQQRGEQQDKHIHLHFHLNLTFRASQGHATHPNAMRIARICVALVGATVTYLGLFIFVLLIQDGPPDPSLTLGNLAVVMLFLGIVLAWVFGCLPLLVSTWRASPRVRFGLFLPLVLLLVIPFFLRYGSWFGELPDSMIGPLLLLLLFPVLMMQPLISSLLLLCVCHEVRALSPQAPTHSRLNFVVVSDMVLTLLGGLLVNLAIMRTDDWGTTFFLPAMIAAVIIALSLLLSYTASGSDKA